MSKRSKKAQVWIGCAATNRVLLFHVIEKRGGGWHPVTGGVESGEDFFEGAKRELREETGFNPEHGEWIDLNYSFRYESRFGPAEEKAFGFLLKAEADPQIDSHEHLDFEWVRVDQARLSLSFDSQRGALDLFSCYLQAQ